MMGMEPGDDVSLGLRVGARVRTLSSQPAEGVIVEDFGDLAGVTTRIDDTRSAISRRWAVALDDGSLVFMNSDSLTVVDHGAPDGSDS